MNKGWHIIKLKQTIVQGNTLISCLLYAPEWRSNLKPSYVPCLKIEPAIFWCTGLQSNQLRNSARAFFFSILNHFYFSITIDMSYYVCFMYTPQWLDRHYITYYMIILINLVPIWHHMYLLDYCLYYLCCTLHSHDYSVTTNLYFLIPLPFSPSSQTPSHLAMTMKAQ